MLFDGSSESDAHVWTQVILYVQPSPLWAILPTENKSPLRGKVAGPLNKERYFFAVPLSRPKHISKQWIYCYIRNHW